MKPRKPTHSRSPARAHRQAAERARESPGAPQPWRGPRGISCTLAHGTHFKAGPQVNPVWKAVCGVGGWEGEEVGVGVGRAGKNRGKEADRRTGGRVQVGMAQNEAQEQLLSGQALQSLKETFIKEYLQLKHLAQGWGCNISK